MTSILLVIIITTLRAKLSGAVYCYRSCLFATGGRAGGVCYHDNSKLRASILTKLGLYVQVVTVSSSLNFGGLAPPGRGSATGRKLLAPPITASAQCLRLSERFFIIIIILYWYRKFTTACSVLFAF